MAVALRIDGLGDQCTVTAVPTRRYARWKSMLRWMTTTDKGDRAQEVSRGGDIY